MPRAVHLDLDGAWPEGVLGLQRVEAREWGPRLRQMARPRDVEAFWHALGGSLQPFVLSGSGDFHHLTALFLRAARARLTLVSFDNHPDWDVRPPRWSCGGWTKRALELPHVDRISVWGCGSFEPALPARLWAQHGALRSGRLEIHPWTETQPASVQRRFHCVTRKHWRAHFARFAETVATRDVYVTIDLDCLRSDAAVTNWESGLFEPADLAWAIGELRKHGNVVGGDVCGAFSPPRYARWAQRLVGRWDHPDLAGVSVAAAQAANATALASFWQALVGG
jgi:arginase family enzyme